MKAPCRLAVQQRLRGAKLLPLSIYQANDDLALQRAMKPAVQAAGRGGAGGPGRAQLPGGVVETATVLLLFGRKGGGFWLGS